MRVRHPWTRRHVRRSMLLVALCVLSAIAPMALLLALKPTNPPLAERKLIGYASLTGMLVFGASAALAQAFWYMPVRRRVIATRGALCGVCLFPLNGLGKQGLCPECGHHFDRDQTPADWRHDLDLDEFDQDS